MARSCSETIFTQKIRWRQTSLNIWARRDWFVKSNLQRDEHAARNFPKKNRALDLSGKINKNGERIG